MKKKTFFCRLFQWTVGIASIVWLLAACGTPALAPTSVSPTLSPAPPPTSTPLAVPKEESRVDGLSEEEVATLSSLEKVDGYPLYTMRYHGAYVRRSSAVENVKPLVRADRPTPNRTALSPAWACSLFAALGDAESMLYGRNFDWEYSPALLLFTDPPDGYASASMVDIAYLGFRETEVGTLMDLSLSERRALLGAPFLPFDGMNEHGLAVGMAAVPPGQMRPDPAKETVGSVGVIRKMLDSARNVDEAVAVLKSYNIDMAGGPPLHYLMADRSGRAVLVEFYQGETIVMPNKAPWHQATNFLRSAVGGDAEGECWRYDRIRRQLAQVEGKMAVRSALDLLQAVSQGGTQWSVVYGISTGDVTVTMGRQYDAPHTFRLNLAGT
jgi:hypothetical protein